MKLAAADFVVWLIIAIIVVIGKIWNKFVSMQADEDEPAPTPPPVRRSARPRPPPVMPRPVSAPAPSAPGEGRQALPEDLREFMERLTRPQQPKRPATPPPIPRPVPPPAKPAPAPPAPSVAETPAEPSRRSSQWAEALRDRQNLRNIIISAEIIGPPRGA